MRENPREVRVRLGRNVTRLRRFRGLSQERLAELASTTNKTVGRVERGENVTIDTVAAIAAGLSVNVAELFGPAAASAPGRRLLAFSDRDLEQIEQTLLLFRKVHRDAKRRD